MGNLSKRLFARVYAAYLHIHDFWHPIITPVILLGRIDFRLPKILSSHFLYTLLRMMSFTNEIRNVLFSNEFYSCYMLAKQKYTYAFPNNAFRSLLTVDTFTVFLTRPFATPTDSYLQAGLFLIGTLGTIFNEIRFKMKRFSPKWMWTFW